MAEGDTVKFDQIADEAAGHIPGDLIFKIKQARHEYFVRDGDNLLMTLNIKLLDSLVGFEKYFDHVDGHRVDIKKYSVSHCSEVVVIKGEGMPTKRNQKIKGDLLVTLNIDFPGVFSENQKKMIKHAFASA